jgi:hypothetical protein
VRCKQKQRSDVAVLLCLCVDGERCTAVLGVGLGERITNSTRSEKNGRDEQNTIGKGGWRRRRDQVGNTNGEKLCWFTYTVVRYGGAQKVRCGGVQACTMKKKKWCTRLGFCFFFWLEMKDAMFGGQKLGLVVKRIIDKSQVL